MDDVTEAAKFTMTKIKIPTDRDADVQCNQWAGLHINMTAIKSFLQQGVLWHISRQPVFKETGAHILLYFTQCCDKALDTGTPPPPPPPSIPAHSGLDQNICLSLGQLKGPINI